MIRISNAVGVAPRRHGPKICQKGFDSDSAVMAVSSERVWPCVVAEGAVLAAYYASCCAIQPNSESPLPSESHDDCPHSTLKGAAIAKCLKSRSIGNFDSHPAIADQRTH